MIYNTFQEVKNCGKIQNNSRWIYDSWRNCEKNRNNCPNFAIADIIVNLQMKNNSYYLIKHFDDDMLDHIRNQFDKESILNFMERFNNLINEIIQLQSENVPSESKKCQQIVKEYWDLIMEFMNGDLSMLPKLMEIGNIDTATNVWE